MKKFIFISGVMLLAIFFLPLTASAAETSNNMTTITVDASDNESGNLMYSIDSDDPEAFTSSNEFIVEAGSNHTVYVKDAAGNISGQAVKAPGESVDIEVTIGQEETDSDIAVSGINKTADKAAESGGGSINEKTVTDGSGSSEKIFYTITTKDENVFYMVIDNTRSEDNVYLLDQVTEKDLISLAGGADAAKTETNIFSQETSTDDSLEVKEEGVEKAENTEKSTLPFILIAGLIMGGGYYYMKIYKPKKDAEIDLQDAMDIDEFGAEEEEDNEEEYEYEEEHELQNDNNDEIAEGDDEK